MIAPAVVAACLTLFGWSQPAASALAARVPVVTYPAGEPRFENEHGRYVRAPFGPIIYVESAQSCLYVWHEATHASDDLRGLWGSWDVSSLEDDPNVGWAARWALAATDPPHFNTQMLMYLGFRYDLFPRAYADKWFPYTNRFRAILPVVREAA